MAVVVQIRRDLAANWTLNNPTLHEGEIGFELDTYPYPFKVGDGVTDWNTLGYMITGTGDHTLLSNLLWDTSGHTGTINSLAGFDGAGLASYYQIGVDIQAYSADLDAIAALSGTAGILTTDGVGGWSIDTSTYLTTETDPIYTASTWFSTINNSTNWNTAYSWGNHAGLYSLLGHTHTLSEVTDVTASASEVNILDLSGLTAGWVIAANTASTASWRKLLGSEITNDLGWTSSGGESLSATLTIGNTTSGVDINISNGDRIVSLESGAAFTSKLAIWDGSNNLEAADTATYPSLTELTYLKGVTSSIQTQLNSKASTGAVGSTGITMNTARILGRTTAGAGAIEEITIGTGLSLSAGTLISTISSYTDEQAQDAVGNILTDSATLDFTYNDAGDTITADVLSAPKWTTARNLAGNSVDGSGNVAFANKFIVQGTADSGLSAAQFLGALSTGIVKNTTTTGVLSIAVAGTDYQAPITPAALTRVDDTNVTLTLGGSPSTSLLAATSLTLGWTGTLAVGRGGTGTGTTFTQGSVIFAGVGGVYSQNNTGFNWDDTNRAFLVYNSGTDARVRAQNASTTGTSTLSTYQSSLGGGNGYLNFQIYGSAAAGTYGGVTKAGLSVQELGSDVTGHFIHLFTSQKLYVRSGSTILLQQHGNSGLGVGVAPQGSNGLDVLNGVAIGATFSGQLAPTSGAVIEGDVGIGIRGTLDGNLHVYNTTTSTKVMVQNHNTAGFSNITQYNAFSGSGTGYATHYLYGDTVGGTFAGVSKNNAYVLETGATIANYVIGVTGGNYVLATSGVERFRVASTGQPTWTLGSDATGDIWYRNASGYMTRLGIGTAGQVLTVASGLPSWAAASGGASPLTTKGDIYTFTTVDARLAVGTDGYILSSDSSTATGLKWITPPSGGTITGTDTHVMFFDGTDNPAGESDFTWTKATNILNISGTSNLTSGLKVGTNWAIRMDFSSLNNIVAFNNEAMSSITSGEWNFIMGKGSGGALVAGNKNSIFGHLSGTSLTDGENIIIIGRNSGTSISTNSNMIVIGNDAASNVDANANIYIGNYSGQYKTSGYANTTLGHYTMQIGSGGASSNTVIGYNSGSSLTGDGNVLLGKATGQSVTGTYNLIIGTDPSDGITSQDYKFVVGMNSKLFMTGDIDVGYLTLPRAGAYVDISTTGSYAVGFKIGSKWIVRQDTVLNNFVFGSDSATYSSITTGFGNFFAGNDSIANGLTSGYGNIAIGFDTLNNEPLRSVTSGYSNIAFLRGALQTLTSGGTNIAMGQFTLNKLVSGVGNIALGYYAMEKYLRYGSIGIGTYAFQNFAGAGAGDDYSIAIGETAGRNVTAGRHVIMGYQAARDMANASADLATVVGFSAGYGLVNSISDTVIGAYAMGSLTSALTTTRENVAVGHGAFEAARYTRYGIAIGYQAGYQGATASAAGQSDYNLYIGYKAGYINLGNDNLFLGSKAGIGETTASNTLIIANTSLEILRGSFADKWVRVNDTLRFTARTSNPSTSETGHIFYNSTQTKHKYYNGTTTQVIEQDISKVLTINLPSSSENIPIFYTNVAITITKVADVVDGTSPSLTWNINHASTRNSGSPNLLFGSDRTTTSESGATTTSFSDATIPANSYIWFTSSAVSGVTNYFNLTMIYTED